MKSRTLNFFVLLFFSVLSLNSAPAQVKISMKIPFTVLAVNNYPEYGPDYLRFMIFDEEVNILKDIKPSYVFEDMQISSKLDTTIFLTPGYHVMSTEPGANMSEPKIVGLPFLSDLGWAGIRLKEDSVIFQHCRDFIVSEKLGCGTKVQLNAELSNIDPNSPIHYKWTPSYGLSNDTIPNPVAIAIDPVVYILTVSNGANIFKDTLNLQAQPFEMGFSKDTIKAYLDKPFNLGTFTAGYLTDNFAIDKSDLTYSWTPTTGMTDSTVRNPKISIRNNTMYHVTMTTPGGCEATDSIMVCLSPMTIYSSTSSTLAQCGDTVTLIPSFDMGKYTAGDFDYDWGPDSSSLILGTIPNLGIPYAKKVVDGNQNINLKIKLRGTDYGNTYPFRVGLMPTYPPEIGVVSVENEKNVILWENNSNSANQFYIYKETFVTDKFEKIGEVISNTIDCRFVDSLSDARIQSARYKISGKDKCDYETIGSTAHKTLHLSINKGLSKSINLIWESYTGAQVSSYLIYRGTQPDNLSIFAVVPGSNNQYTDLDAPADVYYRIETQIVKPAVSKVSGLTKSPDNSLTDYYVAKSNVVAYISSAANELTVQDFRIEPNPASEYLIVHNTGSANMDIQMMDATGRIIRNFNSVSSSQHLSISDIPSGLYFIKVKNKVQKLIIKNRN